MIYGHDIMFLDSLKCTEFRTKSGVLQTTKAPWPFRFYIGTFCRRTVFY